MFRPKRRLGPRMDGWLGPRMDGRLGPRMDGPELSALKESLGPDREMRLAKRVKLRVRCTKQRAKKASGWRNSNCNGASTEGLCFSRLKDFVSVG